MFKLESYITPILLSYVDKYIKNFKPEDSQLSLWGGEVSLHNLDLRLEVLEDELQLPFTFVSGHIHELIIHVPWTKLYSEPICITINTIECILKLSGEESSVTDGGAHAGGSKERRKRRNKQSDAITPPGYVQTMVNKIVSNITINCSNLIVKYVEEDIVMSMNVKNFTFQSANDRWEPEFSDFVSSQLVLRKVIKLSDVTICLDKRNASGKIDLYQEPVLYRCSLVMRLLRCYNSASAHLASVTRLDIHCQKMTFNISELQVPMMMRLLLLARALQNREVGQRSADTDSHTDIEEGEDSPHENLRQDSWTGWAWNLVPAVIPNWSQDWTGDDSEDKGLTFHSGIYIDDLAFNIRLGGCSTTERNTWKNKVDPFLTLSLRGCLLDYICHDNMWVNSQLGISCIQLEPVGPCSCGVNELISDKHVLYFESGSYQENYSSESLFSSSAVENCGEKRRYNFSWDIHQNVFSESSLLEKTPALAIDYLYMVELTEDYTQEKFLELNGDLEYSDLPEHALCRTVMGPFVLRVNSGLLHRADKVFKAAAVYDYQPYATPPPEDHRDLLPAVTTEEYDSLEENIPLRTYQYTVFQPKVEFHLPDHPNTSSGGKRKTSINQQESFERVKPPVLSVECQCMDARFISPMYARRLVRSACLLPTLPQHMFHACHSHAIGRVLGLTSHLSALPQSQCQIFLVNNLSCKRKELYHPHLWEGHDLLYEECVFEAEKAVLTATKAHLLLVHQIALSLMDLQDIEIRTLSSLVSDALSSEGTNLEVIWSNCMWQKALTMLTRCDTLMIGEITSALVTTSNVGCIEGVNRASIFSTCHEGKQGTSDLPFLKACIQWPLQKAKQSHAPLLLVSVKEAYCKLDPLLYAWFLYVPTFTLTSTSTAPRTAPGSSDINAASTRSGHRKISDTSGSHIPCEKSRRSQTPLSVHSSEKDRETIPPPLGTRLSGLSFEQSSMITKSTTSQETLQLSNWLVQWFPVWQGTVVSIEVAHWQIDLPVLSISTSGVPVSEVSTPVDRVCLHLPVVQISSATSSQRHTQQIFLPSLKLPVHLSPAMWTEGCTNFPWNLSLSDLCIWTLSHGRNQYLLKPVTTKCTIGISTRFANGDKDCISSLGLCMHNDTGAVHVTMNQEQALILSNVLLSMKVAAQSLLSQCCAATLPVTCAVPTSPTTISESASVSEPRNPVKNVIHEKNQAVEEPVKLSAWLQWTLARVSINLYQHSKTFNDGKKLMKLVLEVEDLMAALDLQQIYSKVKLKVAGANIHHYVRSLDEKTWKLSPYEGLMMCSYEETSAPASGQVATDDGCGLLTATLTRARCHNVHSRWGAPMSSSTSSKRYSEIKVPGHSSPPEACFITEVLIKLQPLNFLLSMETLTQWSTVVLPFTTLFEEFKSDLRLSKTSSVQSSRLPSLSSASLPLLYLDLQSVQVFMPLNRCDSVHDTFIIQVDSVSLSPHAENPLWRTSLRPDVFHMAEQARILSIPGSEVEDRQYELNITGLSISTGQWNDVERCRRLSATSPASSLRTMSENPALLWNNLGLSTQTDASEIVGNPKPNLLPVLAPLKICFVGAPAIVYRKKVLVCGHALEINAVSDIDVRLSTNQVRLAVDLLTDIQTVLQNFASNSNDSKQIIPLFLMELAEKQYHHRLSSMTEVTHLDHMHLDSGIDTAEISSTDTPHSSRMRGTRRVSRSPRYLGCVHGPSVHSIPLSQSWSMKQERESNISQTKVVAEQQIDLFSGSRSTQQRERSSMSPELQDRDRNVDSPVDFLITAGKISLMLHEDIQSVKLNPDETDQKSQAPRPLLFIVATQPHIFFSQFSRCCSVQVSVYNTVVKLGSPANFENYLPKFNESDFPVVFFESCKGDPDPHTGVPPALCTVQWTFSPSKPAQLSVDLGRPAKLIMSTVNLECLHHISNVASSCLKQCDSFISTSVAQDQPKTRAEQILENLAGVSAISFKSVQLVVIFQAEDKEYINSIMEINVASLYGDLKCTSRTRWGCSISTIERIVSHLACEGLSLVLSHHLSRQLLLEPCNVTLRLELLWPAWLPRGLLSSLPHTQVTVESEYIAVTVSPDHVLCLSNLLKAYKPYTDTPNDANQLDPTLSQRVSTSTPASDVYSNETDCVDTEQHYTDDLRAGAFQFMEATNTLERDQIPLPYQCVFWESSPPAIAWRYPQPRSLTNVHIFPVPFKSAPGVEVGKEDPPVVVCSLQYWSECHGAYQHYATFLLSETNESKVDLPSTPGCAVSAAWRVLLAGTRDLHDLSYSNSQSRDSNTAEVPEVSPRALAACMRIDSFFSASLAPNLQACFNLNLIQVSLMNQLADSQLQSMPIGLQDYLSDGKVHSNHNFLWWSLSHFGLFYSVWPEGRKIIDLNSLSRLDILDYKTLSQLNVIDPFLSRVCVSLSSDGSGDVSLVSQAIACCVGPSVTHTIAVSTRLWRQELFPQNEKCVEILTSQYVVCNNTFLSIVLKQVETDEQILLSSRQCHSYSWRSSSKKPLLHLSILDPSILQLGKQVWSSPFSIDTLGTHICQIKIAHDKKIIIFVKVSMLSTTQKQVILSGQVQVLNQVNLMLDLRMIRSPTDWSMEACNCIIPLQSDCITPSLLLDSQPDDPQLAIRLRLHQVDVSLWTGDIPLRENPKSRQPWLVKVPLQDKHKFMCIWCRIIRGNIKGQQKILVILSPMYAVRSLLPTSIPVTISNDQDEESRVSLELKGQGEVSLLHLPQAVKENTHQLHLRTATNIKIFPFGYSFIDQKQIFQTFDQVDIEGIAESCSKTRNAIWPLPNDELSSIQWSGVEIPNSYVQASYSPLSPYSGTMLLELRPWALILNMLGCDVCIEQSGDTVLVLPPRGVVAPPKLEATFHVGLKLNVEDEWIFSEALQLARANWSKSFYMPRISGLVPIEGHVQVLVKSGPMAMSLLTIGSQIYNEVRVVNICSSFVVSNSSATPLQVTALAVRHNDVNCPLTIPRIDSPETVNATITVFTSKKHRGDPLVKWLHVKSCETDIVPFISVSVNGAEELSCPLPITGLSSRRRFVTPVPQVDGIGRASYKSLVLCVVENNGQTFINIADEPHPQMIIHNCCDFRIICAEASLLGKANNADFKILPNASPWDWFCAVEPYSDMGFNMPSADDLFPQIGPLPPNLFVALAVQLTTTTSMLWSSAIQLSGMPEQFISLPNHGDVKVHIWMEGYITHLSIEAVSRVEICAKDIRSRLMAVPEYPKSQEEIGQASSPESVVLHASGDPQFVHMKDELETRDELQKTCPKYLMFKLTMFIQSLSFTLTAPLSVFDEIEVSALTLDHIAVTSCPISPSLSSSRIPEISVQVTLGDLQLDNQLFERGGFDFPVVLMGQHDKDERKKMFSLPVSLSATASQLVEKFSHQALLATNITLESCANGLIQKSVHVSIGPITAYLEDKYVLDLKGHLTAILSPILMMWVYSNDTKYHEDSPASATWIPAPLPVCLELQVLQQPLRLTSLTVDPIWLLLSVHSSMRLYIALDRSPLQFTQFCRRSVFTTSYNLGHTLSMHYLSGAIFGAGWVVGSLELLGSPGGFARTLGTGLRDFVSLPYHGILQGPWGFLVGVTHGSASLMKHFTAGTLTSVTKMASSVARNLDRLTLDAEHLERTEELRRIRPQGVAEGLLQGLTGLGISLLGAVGGLAHHPLQSVLSGQPSPKGVVTAVGRGLVGVFTKPLSGAADLVAMTGQGLLQGAGWSNLPKPRHQARAEKSKNQGSALIKYGSKIQQSHTPQCLLVLEATLDCGASRFKGVTLILTSDSLVILSADGDHIESQLPLVDLVLPDCDVDPTMVTISFKEAPPMVDQRMWDFVNGCRYVVNTGPPALETSEDVRPASPPPMSPALRMETLEHQSAPEVDDVNPNLNLSRSLSDDGGASLSAVQPAETTALPSVRPPIVFHVNPQIRSHFIVLLKVAQRQMQGQGFQVL